MGSIEQDCACSALVIIDLPFSFLPFLLLQSSISVTPLCNCLGNEVSAHDVPASLGGSEMLHLLYLLIHIRDQTLNLLPNR